MKRREFMTLLGGATAWPLVARAQQTPKVPVVGLMGAGSAASQTHLTTAFLRRLRELGWTEGGDLKIEYRWGEGRNERFAEIAAEFVRLKVDLILTHNTPPTLAAKQVTSVIPIVFATAGDPVGTGIVASLARPGGNITGLSGQAADTAGKRIELLRDLIPDLRRLAILADVDSPLTALDMEEVRGAARALALETAIFEIRRGEDISTAFEALQGRAQAVYVPANPLFFREPDTHQYLRTHRAATNDVHCTGAGRNRGSDLLWTELAKHVEPCRRCGGQSSAWREARRYSGRAADQV